MKKKIFCSLLPLLIIGMLACEDNENETLSLNRIEKKSSYLNLTFIGTKWKLLGFVDVKSNKIKMAIPESDSCYVITFYSDNTFRGITSTNKVEGNYEISSFNEKTLKILQLGGTKINELDDGKIYVANLLKVNLFSITERGLALYYDNENYYILFKPLISL